MWTHVFEAVESMENGKKYMVATSKATPESFLTQSRRSFYSAVVSALGSPLAWL
jgi:hypothetical protein